MDNIVSGQMAAVCVLGYLVFGFVFTLTVYHFVVRLHPSCAFRDEEWGSFLIFESAMAVCWPAMLLLMIGYVIFMASQELLKYLTIKLMRFLHPKNHGL